MSTNMKTHELRDLNKEDLLKQLAEYKEELRNARVTKVTGNNASKLSAIGSLRKQIARTLTVYNQTTKAQARKLVAGKKYAPIDLRAKKTRAIRRRLTKNQANAKTVRQANKERHFPKRKYALKA